MNKNIGKITENPKIIQYLYVGGILCIIAGSFGHFFERDYFKYLFGLGSLCVIASQLMVIFRNRETDFRSKRLNRMSMMLSLMLVLATYSMFAGTTLWIAVVLIYALVTLFLSFRS